MTETTTSPPPKAPKAPEDTTAEVLPFPLKKKPADPDALAAGEVKPGEWEAELPDENPDDDGQVAEGDPVDPSPHLYPPSIADVIEAKDKARRPVLPDWLTSAKQRAAVARWAAGHYGQTSLYHLLRTPVYSAKLLGYAPRGVWRCTAGTFRWVFDAEGRPLRAAAVLAEDAGEYMVLARRRDARVRLRGAITALAAIVGLGAALALYVLAPTWLGWLSALAVTAVLGAVGTPADRPLIDVAKVKFRHRKLTSDIVSRAFVAAGLTTKDQGIAFPQPIRQDGDGWRVVVDLPYGKTFADAVKKREALASGIDVAETQVFLDRDTTSSRRVSMWVANRDPLAVPTGRTPLLGASRVDFWKPFPWGRDERGNEVAISMLWLSLLVGAVPRQGKTFSARTIALAAALDPYVRLYVFDGKASPDWRAFVNVAHRIGFGTVAQKGVDPVMHLVSSLQELKADVEDRYHRLSELPLHICPEGKLTPAISQDMRYNMPLVLFVVDEVQEYLMHPVHGKTILELLVFLARVAPAVGVSVMTATQKPDDTACPSVLRDQHQARFALRVGAYQVSDTILGAGSYSEGLDASRLLKSHKGVGLLKGMTDDSGIVRTYLADGRDAETILIRARALREAEETLTGDAAGEAPKDAALTSVLDDVAAVLGRGETKVWSETVVDRLAETRPEVYGAWAQMEPKPKAEQLTTALKPYGIGTEQISRRIDGKQVNKRGIVRADIVKAITERDKKRGAH
ncbi:cell division protein FtsK [Streptomyces sp. LX-29]|uniref:cell division protein FtsK n=1 Tax=Streptomyces sp. LX-29 TaxID=2900152 RepID=UPI00240E07EF|nr:cell division protein FtsK [Streptomyces sp. LX-29]WFB08617.1 cell division protein FtsK [Streptomyces sp. LX-29]